MAGLRTYAPSSSGEDDEASPQSHEALLISALVESGKWNPETYHVTSDDIVGWGKVWAFCRDYAERASGEAPKQHLVETIHPEFSFTKEVNLAWAAAKVHEDSKARDLRIRTHASMAALQEGDIDGAFDALEQLERPRGHHKPATSLFDVTKLTDRFEHNLLEVPYPTLRRYLKGGMEPAEFMVIAARLAQGKSHIMCRFMATAIDAGWRAACISLEMPTAQVNLRTLKHLSGSNRRLFEMLDSREDHLIKEAAAILEERTPGTLDVFDPSDGNIGNVSFLRDVARDYDAVFVDHMGLMKTGSGARAIEDWRVMATISNVIREITLDTSARVVGIAQVNRGGEHRGTMTTPKAGDIAQADAIGQDATTLITMKRLSRRIMKFSLEKCREGETGGWYGRFDPAGNRWDELSKELALEISADDDSLDD